MITTILDCWRLPRSFLKAVSDHRLSIVGTWGLCSSLLVVRTRIEDRSLPAREMLKGTPRGSRKEEPRLGLPEKT